MQNFGIISDTDYTSNVVIENTVVVAPRDAWALWLNVQGTENYVRDCTFVGPSTNLRNTSFERCTFVTLGVHSKSAYAIELDNHDPLKFRNCRFIGTKLAGAATLILGPNKDIDSSNVEILI